MAAKILDGLAPPQLKSISTFSTSLSGGILVQAELPVDFGKSPGPRDWIRRAAILQPNLFPAIMHNVPLVVPLYRTVGRINDFVLPSH